MKKPSRRAFCRICLLAGAGLSPAISLAKALPSDKSFSRSGDKHEKPAPKQREMPLSFKSRHKFALLFLIGPAMAVFS